MAPFEFFKNVHIMLNSKCNVNHSSVFCQLYNNAEKSECDSIKVVEAADNSIQRSISFFYYGFKAPCPLPHHLNGY
jgi:uncharacterized protein YacL (UPF0231 family)